MAATPADRAVLITGCSSGIGLAVARGLRERGYRVLATARRPADVDRLRDDGFEAGALDISDSTAIAAARAWVDERTRGRLYAVFNNAGYGQPGAVEDLTRDALREQFETNLFGTLELTNQLIPLMRAAGEGRIIQHSSVLGFAAMPWRGAYNASKFALEGITDTLRLELAGTGIHVTLIEPGPIRSRFRPNAYQAFLRHIDADASVHRARYRALAEKLLSEGDVAPFTRDPDAVLKRVVHALESRRPRTRYYVTVPTYLFAGLRRLLPFPLMDAILRRV